MNANEKIRWDFLNGRISLSRQIQFYTQALGKGSVAEDLEIFTLLVSAISTGNKKSKVDIAEKLMSMSDKEIKEYGDSVIQECVNEAFSEFEKTSNDTSIFT